MADETTQVETDNRSLKELRDALLNSIQEKNVSNIEFALTFLNFSEKLIEDSDFSSERSKETYNALRQKILQENFPLSDYQKAIYEDFVDTLEYLDAEVSNTYDFNVRFDVPGTDKDLYLVFLRSIEGQISVRLESYPDAALPETFGVVKSKFTQID